MSPLDIDCPKCGQPTGSKCRSLTTARVTDTHSARWDARWEQHFAERWRNGQGKRPSSESLKALRNGADHQA